MIECARCVSMLQVSPVTCNRRNEHGENTFDTSAFSIAADRAPHNYVTKIQITFLESLL